MEWSGTANREENQTRSFNSNRSPKNSHAPRFLRVAAWCATWRQPPMDGCILLVAAWTRLASWNAPAEALPCCTVLRAYRSNDLTQGNFLAAVAPQFFLPCPGP